MYINMSDCTQLFFPLPIKNRYLLLSPIVKALERASPTRNTSDTYCMHKFMWLIGDLRAGLELIAITFQSPGRCLAAHRTCKVVSTLKNIISLSALYCSTVLHVILKHAVTPFCRSWQKIDYFCHRPVLWESRWKKSGIFWIISSDGYNKSLLFPPT